MEEEKWVLHNFNNYELVVFKNCPPIKMKTINIITKRWYEMIDKKTKEIKKPS